MFEKLLTAHSRMLKTTLLNIVSLNSFRTVFEIKKTLSDKLVCSKLNIIVSCYNKEENLTAPTAELNSNLISTSSLLTCIEITVCRIDNNKIAATT